MVLHSLLHSNLCPHLQADGAFLAAGPGMWDHSFSSLAPLPDMRTKSFIHKTGVPLRTATKWSFGLFTLTNLNLEYNSVDSIQAGVVSSFLSQSYFNSAGLTSKKNSKKYFSHLSQKISQNIPKQLNCWVRRYLFTYSFSEENHFVTFLYIHWVHSNITSVTIDQRAFGPKNLLFIISLLNYWNVSLVSTS